MKESNKENNTVLSKTKQRSIELENMIQRFVKFGAYTFLLPSQGIERNLRTININKAMSEIYENL